MIASRVIDWCTYRMEIRVPAPCDFHLARELKDCPMRASSCEVRRSRPGHMANMQPVQSKVTLKGKDAGLCVLASVWTQVENLPDPSQRAAVGSTSSGSKAPILGPGQQKTDAAKGMISLLRGWMKGASSIVQKARLKSIISCTPNKCFSFRLFTTMPCLVKVIVMN